MKTLDYANVDLRRPSALIALQHQLYGDNSGSLDDHRNIAAWSSAEVEFEPMAQGSWELIRLKTVVTNLKVRVEFKNL